MSEQRKLGKRVLAGSFLTHTEPGKPPQEPPLPLKQLEPNRAERLVARERLGLAKRHSCQKTVRERNGLSRRQVAEMLQREGVAAALPAWATKMYENLAAGNISLAQIGARLGGGEAGAAALVADWERETLLKYVSLYRRFPEPSAKNKNTPNIAADLDKAEGESDVAANAAGISDTGGNGGFQIHNQRANVGFEREHLRESKSNSFDDTHGGGAEHDDYGSESRA